MANKSVEGFLYERAAHDHYVEQAWCTELLLDAETFTGTVWDPACGYGTIPKACERRGISAHGSDIVDRGYGIGGQNFLAFKRKLVRPAREIISNPPYDLAERFIDQALRFSETKVALLLQTKFLNSVGRFDSFTANWPVARCHILSSRPSMPPGEFLDPETLRFCVDDPNPKKRPDGSLAPRWRVGDLPSGGSIDFFWMVLEHGHVGPPTMYWLAEPVSLARVRGRRKK
jgi:hypothetical protein